MGTSDTPLEDDDIKKSIGAFARFRARLRLALPDKRLLIIGALAVLCILSIRRPNVFSISSLGDPQRTGNTKIYTEISRPDDTPSSLLPHELGGVHHFPLPGALNGKGGTSIHGVLHVYLKALLDARKDVLLRGFVAFEPSALASTVGVDGAHGKGQQLGVPLEVTEGLRIRLRSASLDIERDVSLAYFPCPRGDIKNEDGTFACKEHGPALVGASKDGLGEQARLPEFRINFGDLEDYEWELGVRGWIHTISLSYLLRHPIISTERGPPREPGLAGGGATQGIGAAHEHLSDIGAAHEHTSDIGATDEHTSDIGATDEHTPDTSATHERLSDIDVAHERLSDIDVTHEHLSDISDGGHTTPASGRRLLSGADARAGRARPLTGRGLRAAGGARLGVVGDPGLLWPIEGRAQGADPLSIDLGLDGSELDGVEDERAAGRSETAASAGGSEASAAGGGDKGQRGGETRAEQKSAGDGKGDRAGAGGTSGSAQKSPARADTKKDSREDREKKPQDERRGAARVGARGESNGRPSETRRDGTRGEHASEEREDGGARRGEQDRLPGRASSSGAGAGSRASPSADGDIDRQPRSAKRTASPARAASGKRAKKTAQHEAGSRPGAVDSARSRVALAGAAAAAGGAPPPPPVPVWKIIKPVFSYDSLLPDALDRILEYELSIGMRGIVFYVRDRFLARLEASEPLSRRMREGTLKVVRWPGYGKRVGGPNSRFRSYDQQLVNNHAMLSFWGTGSQLFMADLDEVPVLPTPGVGLPDVLAGCLAADGGSLCARLRGIPTYAHEGGASPDGEPDIAALTTPESMREGIGHFVHINPEKTWSKSIVDPDRTFGFAVHDGAQCVGDNPLPIDPLASSQIRGPCMTFRKPQRPDKDCIHFLHLVNLHRVRTKKDANIVRDDSWTWVLDN